MSQAVRDDARERLTRVIALASLAASSIYLVWRWGWTLDQDALWFSVPVLLAETYGLFAAALFTYSAWRLRRREPPPPLPDRAVDVFVTSADEPLAIIRKTALAAREIRYPHTTWLLDDARRDELRAVARELGIGYLRREDRTDGKAGNLNHALGETTGEFILQLDADHVALPQMIDRLIGFFADERLAFVQSPQDFYNTDASGAESGGRELWGDQRLFFNVLQPGKDRANAAMFVGSCALLRRAALADIGGFAPHTTTVGTETSLLLHGRGWHSAYCGENLAFGLAPATARAYQVQQLHRAQGGMQLLRRYQPLTMHGLTPPQRIEYLQTLSTPLGSIQRLILYLAPIVFLTTGLFPIRSSVGAFAGFFLPAAVLRALSFTLLARGQASLLRTDRSWMARFFTHLLAVRAFLIPRRLADRGVPPDAAGGVPLRTVAPQLALIGLTGAALAWAAYARTLGYGTEVPGWGLVALFAAAPLALWHAALAAHVVQRSLAGRHRRAEYRFAESLSVPLRVLRADGKLSSTDIAVTEDLTATGVALRCMFPIPDGARVELTLPLGDGDVRVRGRVVRQSASATAFGTVHRAGIEFDATSRETRDAIELHCAQHAMPVDQQRQRQSAGLRAGLGGRLRELRGERRVEVGMPARIVAGPDDAPVELGVGLLEDVSPAGGRVLLDRPIGDGTRITLHIPGSTVHASGRVVFVQALGTGRGMRFVAGFRTDQPAGTAPSPRAVPWYAAVLQLASRGRSAADVVADTSRAAAERLAAGREMAASGLAASSRAVAERASAAAAASRTAAERLAAESRTALAKAAARARRARSGAPSAAGGMTVPPSADDGIERIALEPMDAVTRAERVSAVIPAAASAPVPAPAQSPSDPERAVEMEIDGAFSFPFELVVGATVVITEEGRVAADIAAVHAIVLGEYAGTLRASRSIRVGPSAHVRGVLHAPDIVVASGAVVEPPSASADDIIAPSVANIKDSIVPQAEGLPVASALVEEEGDEEIFVPSPTFSGDALRG